MEQRHNSDHGVSQRKVVVCVNEKSFEMTVGPHTGLEIKEDAIKAGVSIETDFVLSIEVEPRQTTIIGDSETIDVETDCRFVAIPDDDNS